MFRRRPRVPFADWGYDIRDFHLSGEGVVQFAQWRHPRVSQQLITQEEVDGLRQFIQPGDFAIDIGAHTGDTTIPMALATGATGCVLALEPNPYVFQVLKKNVALSAKRSRIIPQCIAATEKDGDYTFHYGDASFCNGGRTPSRPWWNPLRRSYPLPVVGRNLLTILRRDFAAWLPKLTYVKVDAEGYDRQILKSILPILREYQPVIRTEVFRRLSAGDRYALFDLLADSRYALYRYEVGASPQGDALDRGQMTRAKHFDILAVPANGRARLAA
jgi:FkbM family methyltransferase